MRMTIVGWGLICALLVPGLASAQDEGVDAESGDAPVAVAEPAETESEIERELAPTASGAPPSAATPSSPVVSTPVRSRPRSVESPPDEDDEPEELAREELPPAPQAIFLHGFRFGYLYVFDTGGPLDPRDPSSPQYAERYGMRSPHLFMMGYEATWRMVGYDWLNLILTGNVMFAGFEQSRVFPSVNLLVGAEIASMAQIGIGVSVTPTKEEPVHMIIAAGWTPRIGSFYVPVHAFFVPDISGHHKFGVTVGVNFF